MSLPDPSFPLDQFPNDTFTDFNQTGLWDVGSPGYAGDGEYVGLVGGGNLTAGMEYGPHEPFLNPDQSWNCSRYVLK